MANVQGAVAVAASILAVVGTPGPPRRRTVTNSSTEPNRDVPTGPGCAYLRGNRGAVQRAVPFGRGHQRVEASCRTDAQELAAAARA
jgi:hypothetical protein